MLGCSQRQIGIYMYASSFLTEGEMKYKQLSLTNKNVNKFLVSCPSCWRSDTDHIKILNQILTDDVTRIVNL